MKTIHLNKWDVLGGAARAAHGIHNALLHEGLDSRMQVQIKISDEWRVSGPASSRARYTGKLKSTLSRIITGLQSELEGGVRKGAWFPSHLATGFNTSDADIVHLHWIAEEVISLQEFPSINQALVWTLHDMWPFCGTEHYASEAAAARWKTGYTRTNRASGGRGPDLDRRLYQIKHKAYGRQLSVVAPSAWIADCARESVLLADKPITVIPHPQNLDCFKPLHRGYARTALGLPVEATIIAFGAINGKQDPRKGFNLLSESLRRLADSSFPSRIHLVIFGQSKPRTPNINVPFPVTFTGYLRDDVSLALLYSASDLFVSPARQEAFGLTSAEAACCGCPTVAFDGTGAAGIIDHRRTGYLAKPFDTGDFAEGIAWTLGANRDGALSRAARACAEANWSYATVGAAYRQVYEEAIENHRHALSR